MVRYIECPVLIEPKNSHNPKSKISEIRIHLVLFHYMTGEQPPRLDACGCSPQVHEELKLCPDSTEKVVETMHPLDESVV